MRISYLYIILLVLACPFRLFADDKKPEYAFSVINTQLLKNANVIVRNQVFEFSIKSVSHATEKMLNALTILNNSAIEHTKIRIYEDKFQQLKSLTAVVYDAEGNKVKSLGKGEWQDVSASNSSFISDARYKELEVIYLKYPFTIEFEYEIEHNGFLDCPTWMPQTSEFMAVEKASYTIFTPIDYHFRQKKFQIPAPILKTEGSNYAFIWKVNTLFAKEKEIFSPEWNELVPVLYASPDSFEMNHSKGSLQTWKEFGMWNYHLINGRDNISEGTKTKIKEIIKPLGSKKEKVRALYEYMQSKTRYVDIRLGLGSWQPINAMEVDEKGYGDCKALSNYMKALLRFAGIESYYTLVRAGRNERKMWADFPSSAFNHVILCVPLVSDTIWLECTNQQQVAGYMGHFTDNRNALVINQAGGTLVKTPKYSEEENLAVHIENLTLNTNGDAFVEAQVEYQGLQQEENDRQNLINLSKSEQEEWFLKSVSFSNINIESFDIKRDKTAIPSIKQNIVFSVPAFAAKSGKRFFLCPNIFTKWKALPEDGKKRTSDINLLDMAFSQSEYVKIEIPPNLKLESAFEATNIENPFGRYTTSLKEENGMLIYYRSLQMKGGVFGLVRYESLLAFFKQIEKCDNFKIVLVQK